MSEAARKGRKASSGTISSDKKDEPVTEATSKFWNWAVIFPEGLDKNPNFPVKPGDKIQSKLVKTNGGYSIVVTKAHDEKA